MCLIFVAYQINDRFPLAIAANRDEFYQRPARAAGFWPEHPDVLAGRDLQAGGTWLGITRRGRFAAITNYRDPASVRSHAVTRGKLVSRFLTGTEAPLTYLRTVAGEGRRYNGFNLLVGDSQGLGYYSNLTAGPQFLGPGLYGLSNHLLDTPWPKVERGKRGMRAWLAHPDPRAESLLEMLADTTQPDDASLPDTGVGLEWERVLGSAFITSPEYGTRSSTVVLVDREGYVRFVERAFSPDHSQQGNAVFDFVIRPDSGAATGHEPGHPATGGHDVINGNPP